MNVEEHISWAEVVASKFRREKNIPIEHEEAISLAMVGLMKAAKNYKEDKGKFRSLAWVKIRGELKDWVRTSVRHKSYAPMMSLENFPLEQLPSVNGTEKKVADKELVEWLLEFLTTRQAQTIRLYYLEEYPMIDIARDYGTTEANICLLVQRGLRKMRKAMELGYVWKYQERKWCRRKKNE